MPLTGADREWIRSQLAALKSAMGSGSLLRIKQVLTRIIAESEDPEAVRSYLHDTLKIADGSD